MSKKTIDQLKLTNQRVLVRVDFNVPLDKAGKITDDNRIVMALPSIKKIIAENGKLILMSHLGRPKGEKKPEMSLKPVADRLSELLEKKVLFLDDCIGEKVEEAVNSMENGDVILLENLRFYKEETKNDDGFSQKLAKLGDVYINDAFGAAHRAHASTEGVTHFMDECAVGYLIEKELKYLGMAVSNPKRPFIAILGGAKVSGKIDVINNLMDKVDTLLIGGGMIFTFYKAMGYNVGSSLIEEDKIEIAKEVLAKAKEKNVKLLLPSDIVISDRFSNDGETKIVQNNEIPDDWMGLDIGPKAIEEFEKEISNGKTLVWNGTMGVFEMEKFAEGTFALARIIADCTEKNGLISIIGGGDSAAAIAKANLKEKMTHISTGGGASLEYLEGKVLPGIEAVDEI